MARAIGLAKVQASTHNGDKSVPWGYTLAKYLVFDNVRAALGLDECKTCFSGTAPFNPEVSSFFASLDIPIYEAMGLSETAGISFANYPATWKQSSLGPAICSFAAATS
ncbi:hypothetical protein SDRG_10074 [Saprolegnia diclina VS20]|uniref:AMP-dependent synthetase/ligase domain-containing protein n=1 Tax=Saprolegnia diclina (strain VS20) TaxID=1156394 RepID=T0RQH8_SAPDV|nr:hypothetical protein SDRG_10074 [Saprolegnia diclina VS20]EQC32327.1 hypothetical protein SDRG_10074 [Saprolegnia diclina VS20]|eukprot:XP_008614268.1 hypothetical protein SDRG_10074 [Saprolegnia diclina VS20]